MNAAEIKDIAAQTPSWESEFWSYLSNGDGMHCPVSSRCFLRERGGWCLDDYDGQIRQLYDIKRLSPRNYNFIRRSPCGEIFKMVDTLAGTYLKVGGVSSPPVPTELVWAIHQMQPVEIRTLSLRTCHGALWNFQGKWVIYLKADDSPAMKRFSLFHEAFHVLAHRKTIPIFKKIGQSQGSFNEFLADAFAGSILAPKEWVKETWSGVRDLNTLAKIFRAPKPLICIRLKRMGLI